jgi:thiol:disulfide interchange protein DsbD
MSGPSWASREILPEVVFSLFHWYSNRMLITGNILDLVGVFSAGIVVSLTPCVYPLIPVTAAAIAGANVSGTRGGAVFLSLLYVFGLAMVYAALAVFAATTGKVFGVVQNTPLFSFVIAGIFLFFALAMIDVIRLPVLRIFTSGKPTSPWMVLIMGMASGFAVGPCTAPVLGSLLVYVASKQNIFYGASLLFVFACGVGGTLVLAGTFAGMIASWPRSGAWMVWIKRAAGLVLFVFAGYYVWRGINLI